MDDKRRKLKIPRQMSAPVEFLLKNATGAQLDFLSSLGKNENFKEFVNLIEKFKRHNIEEVFTYKASTADDLVYFRATKIGEVLGLDQLIDACEAAYKEKERRRNAKS